MRRMRSMTFACRNIQPHRRGPFAAVGLAAIGRVKMRMGNLAAGLVLGIAMMVAAGGTEAAITGSTSGMSAGDVGSALKRAQVAIDDMAYEEAVDVLTDIVEADPRAADAYNLLGFSYRKIGRAHV